MNWRRILISSVCLIGTAPVWAQSWLPAPSMQIPRASHGSVVLPDGRVVVFGGITGNGTMTDTTEIYDPATEDWTFAGDLPDPLSRFGSALITTGPNDARILTVGGLVDVSTNTYTSACYIFDVDANTWTHVGDLASPRIDSVVVPLPNGDVFITAGWDGGMLDDCHLFDARANTVSLLPGQQLSVARTSTAAAVVQSTGEVIIAGGKSASSCCIAACDIFDPTTLTLRPGPDLQVRRSTHTLTSLLDGRVLAVGGESGDFNPENTVELLEDLGGGQYQWRLVAARMATTRYNHDTAVLSDGRVVIAGGVRSYPFPNRDPNFWSEVFDPSSETFQPVCGQSAVARDKAAVERIELNGFEHVIVTGGAVAAGVFPSTNVCEYIGLFGGDLRDGLIGYWDFEEGGGTTVFDRSYNGHNGAAQGGFDYSTDTPAGTASRYSGFFGDVGFVLVPDADELDPTEDFTFAAWVNTDINVGHYNMILSKHAPGQNGDGSWGWGAALSPNGEAATHYFIATPWRGELFGEDQIPRFEWHHMAMTYMDASNTYTFYVDGIPMETGNYDADIRNNVRNLNIGGWQDGTHRFRGMLDDVAMYSRSLSQADVAAVMRGGLSTPSDPCDMNCDGVIDAFDIEPFLGLLFDPNATPCNSCTGDANGDGAIDAFDIEPFLTCLFP